MITDELLERGLAGAADRYDVPAGALDRVRERLEPSTDDNDAVAHRRRLRTRPAIWLTTSAAAVVALIVIAIAVGGSGGGTGGNTHSATSVGSLAPTDIAKVPFGANRAGSSATAGVGAVTAPGVPTAVGAPVPQAASGLVPAESSGAPGSASAPSVVPDSAQRVIKTGEMDLQADKGKVSHILDQVVAVGTLNPSAYVADSHTNEGSDPSGSVTLRVPSSVFDNTIARIKAIQGVHVSALQTAGQDVTSQYVDLQARIHALSETRSTYLRILTRASTIGEILSVQQRVNDVQTQIEQLQGQLKVLTDESSFGTLTVTVDQKAKPAPVVHHKSGFAKAVDRSVSRFVNGIESIVGVIGPILLALLVVGFAWLIGRLGYRRFRRQLV